MYGQRISEFSCARKEAVDINILVRATQSARFNIYGASVRRLRRHVGVLWALGRCRVSAGWVRWRGDRAAYRAWAAVARGIFGAGCGFRVG